MTLIELKNLIVSKLGVDASSIHIAPLSVRFHYHGNTYRVTTDLNVEKVDGACLVTDSDARQLEKLLRDEQWDGAGLPPVGAECEIIINGEQLGGCDVLFVGQSLLVWVQKSTHQEGSGYHRHMKFHPLRTERGKAIEQMTEFHRNTLGSHADSMRQLYDAIVAGKIDGLGKVG